jgi:transposase, IS5 family
MSWKNLKQRSLADALLIEHKALTELDDAHELIHWERIEIMLKDIHSSPRGEQA